MVNERFQERLIGEVDVSGGPAVVCERGVKPFLGVWHAADDIIIIVVVVGISPGKSDENACSTIYACQVYC